MSPCSGCLCACIYGPGTITRSAYGCSFKEVHTHPWVLQVLFFLFEEAIFSSTLVFGWKVPMSQGLSSRHPRPCSPGWLSEDREQEDGRKIFQGWVEDQGGVQLSEGVCVGANRKEGCVLFCLLFPHLLGLTLKMYCSVYASSQVGPLSCGHTSSTLLTTMV